jgi:hypothetical protein
MDPASNREASDDERTRREILDEMGGLLREHLAADEWARLLVELVVGPDGEPIVAEMEVEGIVGDEAAVDAAFANEATVRPLLPVLAKATEALCGLEGVEIDAVGGGTYLRHADGAFAWLPGLVRMPSPALVAAWDGAESRLRLLQSQLEARHGLGTFERYDLDLEHERIVFSNPRGPGVGAEQGAVQLTARATLVGSYSHVSRTWAWGAHNHRLPEGVRAASAALIDAIRNRELKELSEPIFATDEATAWALCAVVCGEAGGEGVYRARNGDAAVYLLLRDVRS